MVIKCFIIYVFGYNFFVLRVFGNILMYYFLMLIVYFIFLIRVILDVVFDDIDKVCGKIVVKLVEEKCF